MTQEEVIELARQAGYQHPDAVGQCEDFEYFHLEAFAKLVAEKEREACAVIAEEWFCGCGRGRCPEGDMRAQDIASSIRAKE